MAHIMTTKELSRHLKLHEITICKYAAERKLPAIRIGRAWRFDKDLIDSWISGGQNDTKAYEKAKREASKVMSGNKSVKKRKV